MLKLKLTQTTTKITFKKNLKIFLLLCLPVIAQLSCNTTDPKLEPDLKLELKDVSCTEAWLQLTTNNIQLPATINVLINNNVVQTFSLSTQDSLLYIDSLLPNQTYKIIAAMQQGNNASNELSVTTMDTTTHNFTWQTFTFGEISTGYSSILYDVAIINENNIWAVGEIYMNDSLGNPDPEPYGIANWDGTDWKLKKVKFNCRLYFPNCGPDTMLITPVYSIFARDANDIWIAAGTIHHFNGNNWIQEAGILGAGDAHKIWGNDREIWFVGANGFIAQRSSVGSWKKIESGTNLSLLNIYGNENNQIFACGGNYSNGESILLQINNTGITEKVVDGFFENRIDTSKLFISQLYGIFSSLWIDLNSSIIMGGSYIYRFRNGKWSYAKGITGNYFGGMPNRGFIHGISGNAENDFCIAGEYGTIQHFNGVQCVQIGEDFSFQSDCDFFGVNMYQNYIAVVGKKSSKAILRLFYR